jgi:hypothetical protein
VSVTVDRAAVAAAFGGGNQADTDSEGDEYADADDGMNNYAVAEW